MADSIIETPIILILFNRPDTTKQVFEAIRQAKPTKLLIIADGPRQNRLGEAELCAKTRSVVDSVDWDCEVIKNYSEINLGCKQRVSSGLDWAFSLVEEAIVIEDDCLPNSSFFKFCEEMLQMYRHDRRVMMISGTNMLEEWKSASQSYHFSYYGGIWGWASWRRAWQYYDIDMSLWADPQIKARIGDILVDNRQYLHSKQAFDASCDGRIDAWGYRWRFARLIQSGLSIVPSVNLVSNIGFRQDASRTTSGSSPLAEIPTHHLEFPLKFNQFTAVDRDYDRHIFIKNTKKPHLLTRIKHKLKNLKLKG